jgi:sec-independent protein translocase protein TatA
MLNNLGFGEIATLVLLALLFFGPERLPEIGARVGRWIATLTQSSKVFMNEWREEALVVYDAVEEVKGIRDEILAARAEITGTVTTARDDVNEALSGARADVQAQVRGATTFSPTPTGKDQKIQPSSPLDGAEQRHQLTSPPRSKAEMPTRSRSAPGGTEGGKNPALPATPPSSTPNRAIERTNEILAELREKRQETDPSVSSHEPSSNLTFSEASSLSSLRETVAVLETDVQALRDELARTRAALEAKALSPGSGAVSRTESETDPVPHPQPVHAGEQVGGSL